MKSQDYNHIFIGGLHRAGSSILQRSLRMHPLISGFFNTKFPEDEGQHLQSVYLPAKAYGGPGLFGFDKRARLTEKSALITDANRKKIFSEWGQRWDLSKKYLLEKSPPNLIRTRFLQEIFPNTVFVIIIRHPLAVSFATKEWRKRVSLDKLFRHFIKCYRLFEEDKKYLKNNYVVIKYENFIEQPLKTLNELCGLIGVPNFSFVPEKLRNNMNLKHFEKWKRVNSLYRKYLIKRYNNEMKHFGYDLKV